MRPTAFRKPAIPLLCLLLSATACVEEETIDAPESGSLSSVSNNLETPEAAAAEERTEERDDDSIFTTHDVKTAERAAEAHIGETMEELADQNTSVWVEDEAGDVFEMAVHVAIRVDITAREI